MTHYGLLTAPQVAENWKRQYLHSGQWGKLFKGSSKDIYERLAALPETATRAEIDAIVDGWCSHFCAECAEYQSEVVAFGYDNEAVEVCRACVAQALQMFSKE